MINRNYVLMWAFNDAPEEFKKLSTNGGDEDWLFLFDAKWLKKNYIPSCIDYTSVGSTDRFDLENGDVVIIHSHA